MSAEKRARIEPWPFVLAALLAAMIGVSVGFLRIALDHPDAPAAVQAPVRAAPEPARSEGGAWARGERSSPR